MIGDRPGLAAQNVAALDVLGVEDFAVLHLDLALEYGARTGPALALLAIAAGCTSSEPQPDITANTRYEEAHAICRGLKFDDTPDPDGTPSLAMERCICYQSGDWSNCTSN